MYLQCYMFTMAFYHRRTPVPQMLSYGLHPQKVQTIFELFIGSLLEGAAELARLRE